MSDIAPRTREQRVRRMAQRQGYALRKSGRRDPRALDYDHLWLMREWVQDEASGIPYPVANPDDSLDAWLGPFVGWDELEDWLNADPDTRPNIEDRKAAGEFWLARMRKS